MTKMLLDLLSMSPGIGRAPVGGGQTPLGFPFYQTLFRCWKSTKCPMRPVAYRVGRCRQQGSYSF